MDMVFIKKVRRKVKFSKKLKLWRLRELEVKEEFTGGVGLTTNLMVMKIDVDWKLSNPGILKRGGGIKMWMWLYVESGGYLGFGN